MPFGLFRGNNMPGSHQNRWRHVFTLNRTVTASFLFTIQLHYPRKITIIAAKLCNIEIYVM